MTTTKVLVRLMTFAPPVIAAHAKPGGRCILATAVGLEVLRAFDIAAQPLAVHITIANAQYVAARARGVDPVTAMARGGHLMVTNPENDPDKKAWGGHLVIALPELAQLLDLDHQQFSRPQHGIFLDPAEVFDWPVGTRLRQYRGVDGARLEIETVDDDYWKSSKDWTEPERRLGMARTLCRAVRAGKLG